MTMLVDGELKMLARFFGRYSDGELDSFQLSVLLPDIQPARLFVLYHRWKRNNHFLVYPATE